MINFSCIIHVIQQLFLRIPAIKSAFRMGTVSSVQFCFISLYVLVLFQNQIIVFGKLSYKPLTDISMQLCGNHYWCVLETTLR